MALSPERLPVIIGVGEITHNKKSIEQALEPLALMQSALQAAADDAGVMAGAARTALLPAIDSLDVVCEHSWPYPDAPALLCERLGIHPAAHCAYGDAGGESPVRFVHEAALRLARGECQVAAVVGAEAMYSVDAATKAGATLPWSPRDAQARLLRGADICHPVAVQHGVFAPMTVYPFFENAAISAWGQTPRAALQESAELWSRFSAVAERNPHAWLHWFLSPDEIATPGERNRLIAWPYTKHMMANPLVNMGAAVLLTTLARARALGVPDSHLVHVWGGAEAKEPRDYLMRDQYASSPAQDAVLEAAQRVASDTAREPRSFAALELYSCFPIVPKMARRALHLDAAAEMTATGGLSFFGAPLNNYMTHATAALVRSLRAQTGQTALLYGQGEFVTKHHALVLASRQPDQPLQADYSVQSQADARRGTVPEFAQQHSGPATLETHTVIYGRDGAAQFGTVIARTPQGQRLMARVDASDDASLAVLTSLDRSPVGCTGQVWQAEDKLLHWRAA